MAGFLQAGISRFLFAFCTTLSFVLPVLLLPSAPARAELYETPSLAAQVASGTLPPVSIPEDGSLTPQAAAVVGVPVVFALEKGSVYVRDADNVEHKLRVTKKSSKPTP